MGDVEAGRGECAGALCWQCDPSVHLASECLRFICFIKWIVECESNKVSDNTYLNHTLISRGSGLDFSSSQLDTVPVYNTDLIIIDYVQHGPWKLRSNLTNTAQINATRYQTRYPLPLSNINNILYHALVCVIFEEIPNVSRRHIETTVQMKPHSSPLGHYKCKVGMIHTSGVRKLRFWFSRCHYFTRIVVKQ